jgi:hypothetical protein
MVSYDPDFVAETAREIGPWLTEYLSTDDRSLRTEIREAGETFRINGDRVPVDIRNDDPVWDLGGAANEGVAAAPVVVPAGSALEDTILANTRIPRADARIGATLVRRRFLDAGASQFFRGPVRAVSTVLVCTILDATDQFGSEFVVIDPLGSRPLSLPSGRALPRRPASAASLRRLEQRAIRRSQKRDSDFDGLIGYKTPDSPRRISISTSKSVDAPFSLSDGLSRHVDLERLTLKGGPGSSDTSFVPGGEPASLTPVTHGLRYYAAYATDIDIDRPVPTPTQVAGPGQVFGDPHAMYRCSRSNRDECRNCCAGLGGIYAGAIATTAITGGYAAATTTAAPPAAVIIAGSTIAICAVLFVVGAVHTNVCWDSCNTLYDDIPVRVGPAPAPLRLYLTAALRNDEGIQTDFNVQSEDGQEIQWTRAQLMAGVWKKLDIRLRTGGGGPDSYVRLVNGQDGVYLRASRDRERRNNLALLPEF